jgi:histone H3/H4
MAEDEQVELVPTQVAEETPGEGEEEKDGAKGLQRLAMKGMRARLDRKLRKLLPNKRVSAGTVVYALAAIESILGQITVDLDKKRLSNSKIQKRGTRLDLARVLRSPKFATTFRNFTFTSDACLNLETQSLLTKADRLTREAKRGTVAAKRPRPAAVEADVPMVDEE